MTTLVRVIRVTQTTASEKQKRLLADGYRLTDSETTDGRAFDMTFTSPDGTPPTVLRYVPRGEHRDPLALCYVEDGQLVQFKPDGIASAWYDEDRDRIAVEFAFEFGADRRFCWVPVVRGDVLMTC